MTASESDLPANRRAAFRTGLAALLIAAFGIRAWGLQSQSLFCDEVVEASIARLAPGQIVTYPDGFPPLYHLVLSAWARVFPQPESGRWLSVVFGVAAVYAVACWAKQMAGPATAIVAAGLLAISPLHFFLSREMRAYSLYLCLASFALMHFFQALADDSWKRWAAFAITAALAIGTHYYAALLCCLLAPVVLYYRRTWPRLRRPIAACLLLAVGSLPAILLVPGDVAYQADGFAGRAPLLATLGHTAYACFAGYTLGPSLSELHQTPMRAAALQAAPWAALFAVAGGWLLAQGAIALRKTPYGVAVVLLALVSAPVIGLAGELVGVGPKVRYWCWILSPFIVWLAAGMAYRGNRRWAAISRMAAMALIAAQLTALVNGRVDASFGNEDLRSAAAYIRDHSPPDTPVLVVADYLAPTVSYYLNGPGALDAWMKPRRGANDTGAAGADGHSAHWRVYPSNELDYRGSAPFDKPSIDQWIAAARLRHGERGGAWLVYSRSYHGDPGGLLLSYLQTARAVELEQQFPGVRLYRLDLLKVAQ